MNRKHLYLLCFLLSGVGLLTALYKVLLLGVPFLPDTVAQHWQVEARISVDAMGGPLKVSLYLPRRSATRPRLDESFVSRGLGLSTDMVTGQRVAVWSLRQAKGPYNLYYQARLSADSAIMTSGIAPTKETVKVPQPVRPEWSNVKTTSAEGILARVRQRSADNATLVSEILNELRASPPEANAKVLLGAKPSPEKVVNVAVELLGLLNIAARAVHGIPLASAPHKVKIESWLEVWNGAKWQAFYPQAADLVLPEHFMAWWVGPVPIVKAVGGSKLDVAISVTKSSDVGLGYGPGSVEASKSGLLRFSPMSLPVETQLIYKVILMIPLGAFLIVLIRNVIGFKTLGTFMPVLIAISFRQVHLLQGLLLFTTVVASGLAVRFYFEKLKLLLVPRLAAVMIVVVMLMLSMSVVSHQLGYQAGLSVGLFPMVIMTMTIERLSVVWDERGPAEAMQQGGGSLLSAAGAYFLMNIDALEHLFFTFPELLLVLLAGTLLLGRYAGYRLIELPRFRPLASKGA